MKPMLILSSPKNINCLIKSWHLIWVTFPGEPHAVFAELPLWFVTPACWQREQSIRDRTGQWGNTCISWKAVVGGEICLLWLILLRQKWVWSEGEKALVKFTTTGNRISYFYWQPQHWWRDALYGTPDLKAWSSWCLSCLRSVFLCCGFCVIYLFIAL